MRGKEARKAIEEVRAQGKRFLVAVNSEGFHFREILCVIHQVECQEVHYHTKPIMSADRLTEVIINGCQAIADNENEFHNNH